MHAVFRLDGRRLHGLHVTLPRTGVFAVPGTIPKPHHQILHARESPGNELMSVLASARDFAFDRLAPLAIAWATAAAANPSSWGVSELLVLGVLAQVGLEFYRHGVPKAFGSWEKLPARGKSLEHFSARDLQFVICSQIAIVFMMFHYLQYMATSENVVWKPEQVRDHIACDLFAWLRRSSLHARADAKPIAQARCHSCLPFTLAALSSPPPDRRCRL